MSCLSDQLHYVSGTEIGIGSFLNMEFFCLDSWLFISIYFYVSGFIVMLYSPVLFEFQILDRHSALKFIFLSASVSHPGLVVEKWLG